MQTEHTVNRQLHEYEDIEQGDAGLEYHLALQHHIHQQRQCEGMDYIIEHASPCIHHVKQKEVVGNNEYLYESQRDEGVVYIYYNQSLARLGHFAYLSGPLSPEFIDGLPTYSSQLQNYY